jgi:DUF4097 and DUF4098 domain-containing protein YvlB
MKACCRRWSMAIGFGILSFAVVGGCDIELGSWKQAKSERTISRQVPCGTGEALDVATSSGSVSITGTDTNDCSITARIVAHAPTEEEARELADQVEITAEPGGDTLKIRANRPELTNNRSISVSYTITAPRRMNVLCISDYGRLEIVGMQGTVKGKTESGSVQSEGIRGPLDLSTSYGSIACRDITGPTVLLRSGSGSITAAGLKGSAKLVTSYGSISCTDCSGDQLDLKSESGSLTLSGIASGDCLAVTNYGSVVCRGLQSKTVKLRSSSGQVELADGRADKIDLHTSYGRVKAERITTGDLLANSGSGGIDIACSESCPANLTANVKTAYGSIAFRAPPQFSGTVQLATEYGSVQTALPVTVTGTIDKKNVTGKVGEGAGTICLQTDSGSVDLR